MYKIRTMVSLVAESSRLAAAGVLRATRSMQILFISGKPFQIFCNAVNHLNTVTKLN
jgi:hypothetical protein